MILLFSHFVFSFGQNCTFGYHAGGWGKPPVDEMGKPLYGDVFGTHASDFQVQNCKKSDEVYILFIIKKTVKLFTTLKKQKLKQNVFVQAKADDEEVDHAPWGELEPSDEESSEEEEEEEESDEEKPDETGFFTPADRYGKFTPTAKKLGLKQN